MSILDFGLIKSVFKGGAASTKNEDELYSELMFMVLTRASAADLHIETVEVDLIIEILQDTLKKEFSASDVRVAANTSLYESAPIDKYLKKCGKNLSVGRRLDMLDAVARLFKSDGTTGVLETDFFNNTANALGLTPAQIYRL